MKSVMNIHWKDWYWSWSSNTSATWCKELTRWERPWCWERLKAGGEGNNRWWDDWMESSTWWTWVWASSGSWWLTGMPGVLHSMGSQRVEHDWVTELNWFSRIWDKYLFSEDVERKKKTLCTLGTQIGAATMENNLAVPQKIKNRTTVWSSSSTSRYISSVNENSLLRHACIPMFISALFTVADKETTEVSISIWADKAEVMRLLRGVLLSHKTGWKCSVCQKNGGPCGRHYMTWNKLERRSRYCMASLLCWLYKKRKVNFRTDNWIEVARDWWMGIIGEVYKRVQTLSYKIRLEDLM